MKNIKNLDYKVDKNKGVHGDTIDVHAHVTNLHFSPFNNLYKPSILYCTSLYL